MSEQGWSVLVEGRTTKPVDPEWTLEQLAEYHPSVSFGDGVLTVTITVDAVSVQHAVTIAAGVVEKVVPSHIDIELVEAMTEARQEKEIETSNAPDLIGLAEIAELAGTTRQRVFQMTANKGFPAALLELRSGRLWSRPAIASYLEERQVARGPRIKTLTSLVGGRDTMAMVGGKRRAAAGKVRR